VALNPDGTRIVIAETDLSNKDPKKWHRVVDLISREEVCRFDVGDGGVVSASLVFSSDGTVLAIGKPNNQISFWNASTGTLRNRTDVGGFVWDLAPFADGSGWIASVKGRLAKLDAATGTVTKQYGKEPVHASNTIISPSGSMIATYSKSSAKGKHEQNCISLWDAATGAALAEFELQRSSVGYKLIFSPDSRTLYSHENNAIIAWDLSNGTSRVVIQDKQVMAPALSPDGMLVAYYSNPELVIHDLVSGKDRRLRTQQFWPDSNPVFFPGGTLLATSSNSHFVIWDLALARPPAGK
jgi:WD40 repeat protein